MGPRGFDAPRGEGKFARISLSTNFMRIERFWRHPMRWPVRRVAHNVCAVAAFLVVAGCRRGDEGVTISGDVEGLDTIALRGAALLARADSQPGLIDSLKAIVDGRLVRPRGATADSNANDAPAVTGKLDNPMAERARLLADSMVRASARQAAADNNSDASARDTVRGIVTLVGSDPSRQVMLRAIPSGVNFAMSGMATMGLSRLEGLELVIRGVLVSPRDLVVGSYVVRASNGVPAYDGTLMSTNGAWYLQLSDGTGRKRIAVLPSALRDHENERVWIAISTSTGTVQSFGAMKR